MKKICLVGFCLLLLIEKNSFAKSYRSFPDSGADWNEMGSQCPFWDPGDLCSTYKWLFSLSKDTMINNLNYKLLGYDLTAYSTWILGGKNISVENYSYDLPGEIFGAIREDSSKKVWFKRLKKIGTEDLCLFTVMDSDYSEILLYDFSVLPGDTLRWLKALNYGIVQSEDSVQLGNGAWRKRIWFLNNGGEQYYWIEGVGSNLGLFGAYQFLPFEGGCKLSCFTYRDTLLLSNELQNGATCDQIATGIPDVTARNFVSVFPNPASDFIHFSFANTAHQKCELQIRNTLGELISQFEVGDKRSLEIPVSSLGRSEMYYYQLISDHQKIFSGKFLIEQ